ncbi:MAG: radical SAM protein, partial [Xanthobacteraceae bacterium]
ELVAKHARALKHWFDLELMVWRARRNAGPGQYVDRALTPVADDETETLEMFTHNEAARHEVAHIHTVAALTHGAPTAA